MNADLFIDLLDPQKELNYKQNPALFWEEISALQNNGTVIVDEIQRVPVLLDYVQKGIEEKRLIFILSGSSARKLKRGGANLLGGRAFDRRLHPLTLEEMGEGLKILRICQFGTLPKVAQLLLENDVESTRLFLKSYYTTYIKEEIQAEAAIRNVGAFQRFFHVAAQSNAQVVEFSNIARECGVPMSTVKTYYTLLEDTLMGDFLWPWNKSERKKARPKFYFFDPGVICAIQNRLHDALTPFELGFLFETWVVRELIRIRDNHNKPHEFSFWRDGQHEIDIVVSGGRGPVAAFEIKSGFDVPPQNTIKRFRSAFPNIPIIVISLKAEHPRQLESGITVMPYKQGLDYYSAL